MFNNPHYLSFKRALLVALVITFSLLLTYIFFEGVLHGESDPAAQTVTASSEPSKPNPAPDEKAPNLAWDFPFIILLGSIAILPIMERTSVLWEDNRNKLLLALILSAVTCFYFLYRGWGFQHYDQGLPSLLGVLREAILADYIPFMTLLFSLYVISGGINISGHIPAHPRTNLLLLAMGGLLASLIGTTGAAMLLIRPLLQINKCRRHVKHTFVFFIFVVCNCGGLLLPLGDPPLFLGFLRGVPFLWTLKLFPVWATAMAYLLIIYFIWDNILYKREPADAICDDEKKLEPIVVSGKRNFYLLAGVILCVALVSPATKIPGTDLRMSDLFIREIILIILAGLSIIWTAREVRKRNDFNYVAITEVACLFIGIFVTMQVPIEILQADGPKMGFTKPWQFFWSSGALSSFLDNAPTYVVFFTTAGSLGARGMSALGNVLTSTHVIAVPFLKAVTIGSVFMGANTYIGNGPNFMVKSIAESSGVKMPTFFGYIIYSVAVLFPLYFLIQAIFLR